MINNSKTKEPMPMQNALERSKNFGEVELGLSDESALNEARRCLNCKARPCVKGCPVGVRIPDFIKSICDNDCAGAYNIITKDNAFPAMCGRVCPQEKQCEAMCVRGKTGEPVSIGRLERYVADKFIKSGLKHKDSENKKTGYKVAVVGSGPSGLACASELARFGHEVTIFEALHKVGGVLTYGIPEFRLPRSILNYEIESLKSKGVNIVTDTIIGKSFSISDLFKEGYKAVYIASGAGLPKFMNIPGEGMPGVYSANEFLTRINLMKAYKEDYDTPIIKPKNVVVVGGGNVAMDAARCAKRLGADRVTVIYRRTEEEMPARKDEISHAKEEEIEFLFLSNPIKYFGNNAKVEGVEYIKMKLGDVDSSGRKSVTPIHDKTYKLEADTVIVAIGNASNPIIKNSCPEIEFDERGRIRVNPETLETSYKLVYAGGDIVTGAATVILAMGAGKKAAYSINKRLSE